MATPGWDYKDPEYVELGSDKFARIIHRQYTGPAGIPGSKYTQIQFVDLTDDALDENRKVEIDISTASLLKKIAEIAASLEAHEHPVK